MRKAGSRKKCRLLVFPGALPLLLLVGFFWGMLVPPVLAQHLPPEAASQLQQAIEHLRTGRYALAEELLSQLERRFPDHTDIQEALAIVLASQGKPQAATPHFEKVVKLKPSSARAHQNLGANYLRLGRLEGAEHEFQRALKLEPENPNIQFNLGSLYLLEHKFEAALPYLQRAHQLQPSLAENSYKLALCYFFLRQHEETGKLLAALEAGASQQWEFLILLGLNHVALGHETEARNAFDRALGSLPSSPEAYEGLGQMFFQLGFYAEAVPVLERALEKKRDSYQLAYSLAVAYQGAGHLEKARAAAQEALQKWETADLHHLLGGVNEELGSYVEAVRHFQRAAEMDPSERNLYDLGYEFLAHWSWDAALVVFQEALKLHPKSERLWLGAATSYYAQGDFQQTIETLLQTTEVASNSLMAYSLLVSAYPRASSHAEVVRERLRRFQEQHPDDPWANYYYGFSLVQTPDRRPSEGELAEGARLLRRAVTLKPDLADAHHQLGLLFSEQQQWHEAVSALEAAIRAKPDYVEAHYQLALAYRRVGESAQAQAMLARYRALKQQQDAKLTRRESERTKFIYSLKP